MMHQNELTVIGAALETPGLWLAVANQVTPDLFSDFNRIAAAICDLTQDGKPTDPQTVAATLQGKGIDCRVSDLLEIANHAPMSSLSLTTAVDGLIEASKRRAILQLANQIRAQAAGGDIDTDDILASAVAGLTDIGARSANGLQPMSQILQTVMKDISRPRTDGIKTGISTLDAVTAGFKPGQLIVLGARPSMGKTALALGIVRQAAAAGKTAAVFSLEMTADEVCHRILADLSGVDLMRITTHRLSSNDYTSLTTAAATMHKYRIFVGETGDNLGGVCRQIKHKHGLDLVVIDYLQLLEAKARSREQEIASLSRGFKALARQLGCPVLLLSQLSRQVEQRANKRPVMADLRESGSIEQDADLVLLLWRPGYYDRDADQTEAELIVDKHRNGPTGAVPLHWSETTAKFTARKSA